MTRFALALSMLSILPSIALAQGYRDRMEDRRDLGNERRELRDDRRDLDRLEALLADLDQVRARERSRIAALDDAIAAELAREHRESRFEAAKDRQEVRRADDRRELRDDRRDLAVERRTAARRAAIGRELQSLRGRYSQRHVDRRRILVGELVQLGRAEIRHDRQEIREDRRELREDHRELRGDHRDFRDDRRGM